MMKPRDQQRFDAARDLQRQGDFAQAVRVYRPLLRSYPRNGDLLESVSRAFLNRGNVDDAEMNLRRLIDLEPERVTAHRAMALVLRARQDMDGALEAINKAIELDPEDRSSIAAKAELTIIAGRPELGVELVVPLIDSGERHAGIVMVYADLASRIDRREHAIEVLSEVIADHATPPNARTTLLYRRSNLQESLGQYDGAFADAKRANAGVLPRFKPDEFKKMVDTYLELWTPETFESAPASDSTDQTGVYVIGMPRSGTSLTEQILGRHPRLAPGGERNVVIRTLRELELLPKPDISVPTAEQIGKLSAILSTDLRSVDPTAARITNKMPTNFQFVPYIAKASPGARFIHCRRDPLDSCMSCFMLGFMPPVSWSNSLRTAGLFSVWYRQMMDAWSRLEGIRIHTVDYEELVSDPEPQIRAMLDFLGLEFDQACLRPEESTRVVYTASNDQVRQKIGTGSIGRHKRFEAHLGPLREALGFENE